MVEGVRPVQSAIEPFPGIRILRADFPFIGTKVIVWLAGWPLHHLECRGCMLEMRAREAVQVE